MPASVIRSLEEPDLQQGASPAAEDRQAGVGDPPRGAEEALDLDQSREMGDALVGEGGDPVQVEMPELPHAAEPAQPLVADGGAYEAHPDETLKPRQVTAVVVGPRDRVVPAGEEVLEVARPQPAQSFAEPLAALGEGEAGLLARGDGDRTVRFRGAAESQVFPVAAVAAVDRAPPVAHDDLAVRPVPGELDHPRSGGWWFQGRV